MSSGGKHRDDYSDEFDDSEEEDFKPKTRPNPGKKPQYKKPSQKVINLGTAGGAPKKKTTKRPGSSKTRPSSAPSSIAIQLWQNALSSGEVSAGGVKTATTKRPAVEYWNESLRRTGMGLSTESSPGTMSGLSKKKTKEMAYSSTSHYLRQLVGTEKPKRSVLDSPGRTTPGRPAYKSPEEYYDEILDLKKQITVYQSDNSNMKSKVRRLEEDNLKKEREIEQLLDPSKSDELRRTLTDRKPDAGAVIHSLKQKILKLEHQLKDREAAYARIQSDLKTTKIEEMKLQIDTFYKEIVRLNQLKSSDALPSRRQREEVAPRENNVKMKALQETILRMNEKNLRLTTENKSLRTDLERVMEDSAKAKDTQKDYEDMSKKQLMTAIGKLEKRLDKADADSVSILSDMDQRKSNVSGKVTLEGSVAQRLDQLDQRETELLEELEKQRGVIKRLKDDRVHYRKKAEDKEKEIKALKKDVDELQAELDSLYEKDRSRQPTPRAAVVRRRSPSVSGSTPRKGGRTSPQTRSRSPSVSSDAGSRREERERNRRIEQFRQDTAAKHIQRNWRSHRQREREDREQDELTRRREATHRARVDDFSQARAARQIQRGWRHHRDRKAEADEEVRRFVEQRDKKLSEFTKHRAARLIQTGWSSYQAHKREAELEETAEFLQSALRGHLSRRQQIASYKNRPPSRGASVYDDDSESVTESELDSAAELIQSNLRGHLTRKDILKRSRLEDPDSDLEEAVSTVQSAFRGHLARKGFIANNARRHDLDYDHDEAVVDIQAAFRSHLARKNFLNRHRPDSELDEAVIAVQAAFRSQLARRDFITCHRTSSRSPTLSRSSNSHGRHRLDSAGEEEDEDDKYSSVSRASRRSSSRPDTRSTAKKPPLSPRKSSRAAVGDSDDDSDDDDDLIVTPSSRGRIF